MMANVENIIANNAAINDIISKLILVNTANDIKIIDNPMPQIIPWKIGNIILNLLNKITSVSKNLTFSYPGL